jgi:hypothetical protein
MAPFKRLAAPLQSPEFGRNHACLTLQNAPLYSPPHARVVELVDALDSKSEKLDFHTK